MRMNYVRRTYGVPAKRGGRVTYNGKPGRITSADSRIRVRFDGDKHSSIIHPTDDGLIAAWLRTGDGWNGEYAEGTHDGSRSFRDCNPDTTNPYRTQEKK